MRMMGDEQAKQLFDQVRQSRESNEEGITGWMVTEHEDWLDVNKAVKRDRSGEKREETVQRDVVQDPSKIVEDFKAAHPDVEVTLGDVIKVGADA